MDENKLNDFESPESENGEKLPEEISDSQNDSKEDNIDNTDKEVIDSDISGNDVENEKPEAQENFRENISDDSPDEEKPEDKDPPVILYRWDYEHQFENDKKVKTKDKALSRKGAITYAVIMFAVFALAFSILAVSLSLDKFHGAITPSYELTIPQIAEKGMPSAFAIVSQVSNTQGGTGSGFAVTDTGYIVTNYHVIENAKNVTVIDSNNEPYNASVVGYDKNIDIAVLYVESTNAKFTPAVIGDSDSIVLGETVVAIGAPDGLQYAFSVSNGIVSGKNRKLSSSHTNMIQTNAELNPGNSGGPLFNSKGEVIGIVTSKITHTIGDKEDNIPLEGMSFAIPVNDVRELIAEWIDKDCQKPMLGITGIGIEKGKDYFLDSEEGAMYNYGEIDGVKCMITPYGDAIPLTEKQLNNKNNKIILDAKATGIYVTDVVKGLGAYGKLEVGDIVTKIGDVKIEKVTDARKVFSKHKPGDKVKVEFYRNGKLSAIDMTLKTKGEMLEATNK